MIAQPTIMQDSENFHATISTAYPFLSMFISILLNFSENLSPGSILWLYKKVSDKIQSEPRLQKKRRPKYPKAIEMLGMYL